ncbi:MAG: ABC transporter substrate-binding protein [Bacillota bacterium]
MVKHGKNVLLVIGIVLMGLVLLTGNTSAEEVFEVGISQLVEHPALDGAREGFIKGLEESGFVEGDNIEFKIENAQGDFSTAQSIAKKFKNDGADLVLAIATPSAQAAANVIEEIPLLITAVTDPVSAGLVDSMEKPGGNITGTTDMNPVRDQFELIKDFLPDVKTVGILYNSGEANSKVQVDIAKEVAEDMGIEIKEGTATNSSEVQLAASSLIDKVDAIYLPTDNVMASAISAILKVTNEKGVPVFGSESGMVESGAVATKGINYFELGRKTGQMAAEVLDGKDPGEMDIEGSDNLDITINKNACEKLGLKIPSELLNEATKVIE